MYLREMLDNYMTEKDLIIIDTETGEIIDNLEQNVPKLTEIEYKPLKRGRKPWKPTEEDYIKVYEMCKNGATQDNEIYPKFGIGKTTYYAALKLYPEISNAFDRGCAEYIESIKLKDNDIMSNPEHKEYSKHIRAALTRYENRNNKVKVDLEVSVRPLQSQSTQDLLDELED